MPNGPTHKAATKILLVASLPSFFLFDNPLDFLAFEAGVAATLLISPDMDIHNRLGLLGDLLGFDTYRKLVPHRGGLHDKHWYKLTLARIFALSHIPLIGTLPRTTLLLVPIIVVLAIFSALEYFDLRLTLWLWLGMSLSDGLHTLMDLFPHKRIESRGRQEIYWGYKGDRMQFYRNRGGRPRGRP